METDRSSGDAEGPPSASSVAAKVAELRGIAADELERVLDANADRFLLQAHARDI